MTFSLPHFLPYLLNQAAEAVSQDFQDHYRNRYGMLRTEWRVLFHLGVYGDLTATQICELSSLHKTKVSRAVAALQDKRFLSRETVEADRRNATLTLTPKGQEVFKDLHKAAEAYDAALSARLDPAEAQALRETLLKLMGDLQKPS